MKKFTPFLIFTLITFLFVSELHAQKFTRKKRYLNFGMTYNTANYFGDLVPKSQWGSFDVEDQHFWSLGLFLQKKLWPHVSQRTSFNHIRLKGDDFIPIEEIPAPGRDPDFDQFGQFRYRRNLSFRNDVFELSHIYMWELNGSPGVFFRRYYKWNPYAFIGLAGLISNPRTKAPEGDWGNIQGGDWVPLRKFQTEGQTKPYPLVQVAVPFGIGLRKYLNPWWDFHVEIGFRMALTDYLDDVSTNYIDLGFFDTEDFKGGPSKNDAEANAQLARALSDRSRERIGALTEGERDRTLWDVGTFQYESRFTGENYEVTPGYGSEQDGIFRARRGDLGDNDAYVLLSIGVSYVFDRNVKTPRYTGALRRFDNGRRKRNAARRKSYRKKSKRQKQSEQGADKNYKKGRKEFNKRYPTSRQG